MAKKVILGILFVFGICVRDSRGESTFAHLGDVDTPRIARPRASRAVACYGSAPAPLAGAWRGGHAQKKLKPMRTNYSTKLAQDSRLRL